MLCYLKVKSLAISKQQIKSPIFSQSSVSMVTDVVVEQRYNLRMDQHLKNNNIEVFSLYLNEATKSPSTLMQCIIKLTSTL